MRASGRIRVRRVIVPERDRRMSRIDWGIRIVVGDATMPGKGRDPRKTHQTDLQGNRLRRYRFLGVPIMRRVPGDGWSR